MRFLGACLSVALIALVAGCTSPRIERELSDIPIGPVYKPRNIHALASLPDGFFRVAVLPLGLVTQADVDAAALQQMLVGELRQLGRFEVVEISAEVVFRFAGKDALQIHEEVPEDLLLYLAQTMAVDGVLQNDLTAYRPYRPFVVGLRCRLFDIASNDILWAVDELVDAAVREVHTGARKFAANQLHEQYPYADTHVALRSPGRFASYVAFTLYQSIPAF